jgi:hypothetical protein
VLRAGLKKGNIMVNPISIILRRRTSVFVKPVDSEQPTVGRQSFKVVADLENRLERLGYTLDDKVISAMLVSEAGRLAQYADDIVTDVAQLVGAVDRNGKAAPVKPMYPNFPRQVEEASAAELYLNAIAHYFGAWAGVRIMPEYDKLDRGETKSTRPLRVISLVDDLDATCVDIFLSLTAQKAAWSELDRDDIRYLLARNQLRSALDGKGYLDGALSAVSFGSSANLGWFAKVSGDSSSVKYADSLTDVLRIAVAVAGGNPEFVKPAQGGEKLGNIPREWRRAILGRMNQMLAGTPDYGDVRRRLGLWKLVGKLLHVGEYRTEFVNAFTFFSNVRSGKLPKSNRGLVQQGAVSQPRANMLRAEKPGEFARDLDWALRTSSAPYETLASFAKVAHRASARTLWGAYNALENRDAGIRVFLPKGNAQRAQFASQPLPPMDARLIEDAQNVVMNALRLQYASKSPVPQNAKVFIDPALYDYAVPFQVREQGVATRVIGRGSRIRIEDGEYLRFFVWWKDIQSDDSWGGRVDLDLSLSFMNEQFEVTSEVAYYNLRNAMAVHSGDITSAPEGAAEYIDISRPGLRKLAGRARYAAVSVLSFTHQPYSEIPEAVAGVMVRENLDKGEVFDGKTVETAFSLTQDSDGVLPFVFDMETNELVWVGLSSRGRGTNAAGAHRSQFSRMVEAAATRKPVTVGQLVAQHAQARGATVVASAEDAQEVYGPDTAFQVEKLLSEWL